MRGICSSSVLATNHQFLPKQLAASPNDVFFVGATSFQIRYNDSSKQWILTDAVSSVRAELKATKVSYSLGKHEWTVNNDHFPCNKEEPYKIFLKLSGCIDGDFTCDDGQCVKMNQRCNQVPNCRDESDEVGCKILVLKNNYNLKVPPIVPLEEDDFEQAQVNISITLLKIVNIEEVLHKIQLQFEITLEWRENRATYQNLKEKTSLNALTDEDIGALWLPYVIYANTDMKEAVELISGSNKWRTVVTVTREGKLTRSSLDNVEEIELFQGKESRLSMSQTYTKEFQCKYHLQRYPFDTQVGQLSEDS